MIVYPQDCLSRNDQAINGLVAVLKTGASQVESIHGESFATRERMRHAVFEYIEVDYNRVRRHSAIGYIALWRLKHFNMLNSVLYT